MLRYNSKLRHHSAAAIAALTVFVSSCATESTRAVVDVVPRDLSYSLEVAATESAGVQELVLESPLTGGSAVLAMEESAEEPLSGDRQSGWVQEPEDMGFMDLGKTLGSGVTQLDPERGPMDLGYPLLIDLGAGEFPFDDGVRTIHGVELTRGGFSDAVVQASWRESMTPASMLHATVAMTRIQDLGMIEGIDEMRFAWAVLGWKIFL